MLVETNYMNKVKIEKNTVQETLMLPLWGRIYCHDHYPMIFPDPKAKELESKIDYDFSSLKFSEYELMVWALRARMMSDRIKLFLEMHPRATIVNLGCGADVSFYRVDNGLCHWVNVDLPDVVKARESIIDCSDREETIACDMFDESWMKHVADTCEDVAYIMCAGVLMYFTDEKLKSYFETLGKYFPSGAIYFDALSDLGLKKSNNKVHKKGNNASMMYFSVNNESKFDDWGDYIKKVTIINNLPDYLTSSKDIPFKDKLIFKLGIKMGIMKFVELLFKGD